MKKIALVVSFIMLVTMSAGTVLAAQKHVAKLETLQAQVVSMDAKGGKIVVTTNNKQQTLKASAKVMKGLVAGDQVRIEESRGTVKSIKKLAVAKQAVETPKKTEAATPAAN